MRRLASSPIALGALLALALAGCTITRTYVGVPLAVDPGSAIEPGETDKAGVLRAFGAPERILRHVDGDVFLYRYVRKNQETLAIEEPVITNLKLFTYTRSVEREDRLVVLFDAEGLVSAFGYVRGTAEFDKKSEDDEDAR